MKRVATAVFLALLSISFLVPAGFGQQEQSESNRKILNRVTPLWRER
jgi:hypothetical protein